MTQEVTEETRETLHVLELPRLTRPQKLASESAFFDGAHEVRFTERTFRPRHGASLDEVRSFVDTLEVKRRELLNAPAGASGSSASPAVPPLPALTPAQTPAVAPRIPDHYREPLEAVIRGALIAVETVHRVGTGTVVDVLWESEDEGERRGLYVIEDGVAKPHDAVERTIDALPEPAIPRAPQPGPRPDIGPSSASEPASAPEKPKKRRFGFGKKAASEPKPGPDVGPSSASEPASAPEEPKKRRFGFGKK